MMRFSETEYTNPGQLDFVPRERNSQIWKVAIGFCGTIILIFVLGLAPDIVGGKTTAALISMAAVAVLCFYVIYRKQQSLDLVMATEFQNMLFSQAAALGSTFCIFVKRDGTIVYANDGLTKLFPHYAYADSEALEAIFDQGGVRKPDRERIMGSIYASQHDRVLFPIRMPTGETKDFILTIEPLTRPGGFMVIRGRPYRDQRTGMQLLPDVLRSTSADKLDHLLATTAVAHFVTDGFGSLEYANPALELMLGYEQGELTGGKVALRQLVYQLGNQRTGEDYTLADYVGEATLRKKQGALVTVVLQQSVLRDAQGKVSGATGSILPHEAPR